ncbi:MAG: hypothetical protein M5U17_13270 [Ignavibacterium sp.]|nr:hypothetical protein [Ignavibacterium sp.]
MKPLESCIKKLKRKNITCESLIASSDGKLIIMLNDFLGFRILCNTLEDVYQIAEIVKSNKRFTLIKEQDFNKKPKETGYRALHLDLEYERYWEDDEKVKVPIELQIKTHLQHAWSEITHDESYKPTNDSLNNEWEQKYSKHMADLLDQLDSMAKTIRDQRVKFIPPPKELDSDKLINQNTLSYKINELRKDQLTQQEMSLCITRLKELNFENLLEVNELLTDEQIEDSIKKYKEELKDNSNVKTFEILFYGSLLKKSNREKFEKELSHDYGFVEERCEDCGSKLTKEDYDFILNNTDGTDFYCKDHRRIHYDRTCLKCGKLTKREYCINCEAELDKF